MRMTKVAAIANNPQAMTGGDVNYIQDHPVPARAWNRTLGVWLVTHVMGIAIAVIMLIAAPIRAQTSEEAVFARAVNSLELGREAQPNVVEARRHFRAAAEACAELHRQGVASPELYLLWGNAELLADRVPRAIWAYHAGLRLVPWHHRLREHLAVARQRVAAAQNERTAPRPNPWPAWLPAPWTAFVAASLAFNLACVCVATWYVARSACWGWMALAGVLLTLIAGSGCILASVRLHREHDQPRVVIADPDTPMNLGNGQNYPPHPETPRLPAGAEGRLLHRRGSWLRIVLPAGDVGWIPTSRALVVPSH